MPPRPVEYHRPKDRQAALELFLRSDRSTAALTTRPRPWALAEWGAEVAVDLSQLGLDYITESEDGTIRIGTMTPLETMAQSPLLQSRASGLLAKAAWLSAAVGIRRLATIAAAEAPGWPPGPPEVQLALLALDAEVVAEDELMYDFMHEPRWGWGAILVEFKFRLPPTAGVKAALERVARTPRDQAIVAVAAALKADGDICRQVRLAIAGAVPHPQRLPEVENLLEGQRLSPEAIMKAVEATRESANSLSDHLGSAEYRREMAGVLVRRALESLRR